MKMPRQSIIYLVVCLTGVVIYLALGIIPLSNKSKVYEKRIETLKDNLEIQRMTSSFYQEIKGRAEIKKKELLPLPEAKGLPRAEIDKLGEVLRSVAANSRMITVKMESDLSPLSQGGQLVPVVVVLKGNFPDFRRYLIALHSLPYLRNLEELVIRQTEEGLFCQLKFHIIVG